MRTLDFAPLYRTTVGFDRLFDMLDNAGRPDWPPYNIEKKSENEYRISMAIAGFGDEDIELTQNGPELTVVGQKKLEENDREILHQGLALRNFKHTFKLADHVKVASARWRTACFPSTWRARSGRAQASAHRDRRGAVAIPRPRRSSRTPGGPKTA